MLFGTIITHIPGYCSVKKSWSQRHRSGHDDVTNIFTTAHFLSEHANFQTVISQLLEDI
jgi:hypothetical protein